MLSLWQLSRCIGPLDQLICPIVECKASISAEKLAQIGGEHMVADYNKTLQRIRVDIAGSASYSLLFLLTLAVCVVL
jgi:hypothetical protein